MKQWLLVEDEPDLYDVLLTIYEIAGYHGIALTNGEAMLNWIDDIDDGEFDASGVQFALLDIRLPGAASGVDVAARLRESPHLNNIAVILMTAYRLNPDQERDVMEYSGADRLIYKPLPEHAEMMSIINNIIADRQNSK